MELDYSAELYSLLHDGIPGDIEFYREQCRGYTVLELGCGSGRVLAQLAQSCPRVVGLERHGGMRALARRALGQSGDVQSGVGGHACVLAGDMAEFELEERFDRIIIPFSAFWCLLSTEKKRACLRSVIAHLAPKGRLIFDVYATDELMRQKEEETGSEPLVDAEEFLTELVVADRPVQVYERNTWWPSRNRIDVDYSYRDAGNLLHQGSIRQHYLHRRELCQLVEDAGLGSSELYELDDFHSLAPSCEGNDSDHSQWVIVAKAPN